MNAVHINKDKKSNILYMPGVINISHDLNDLPPELDESNGLDDSPVKFALNADENLFLQTYRILDDQAKCLVFAHTQFIAMKARRGHN